MRPFHGWSIRSKEEPPPSPPPTRELEVKSKADLEEANYKKRLEEHRQSRTSAANEIPASKSLSRRVATGDGGGDAMVGPAQRGKQVASTNSLLEAFLIKVKTTRRFKALQNDVDAAALLRYKEMEWRQGRLQRGQGVPDRLTFEKVKKRKRPPSGDELETELQQGNESNRKYLKRLTKVHDRMREFNNMLEIEGEDCWDEASDDSFEQKVEEKLEDMHFE